MGQTKTKSNNLFEDLLTEELESETLTGKTQEESHLDEFGFDVNSDINIEVIDTQTVDDFVPPVPKGFKDLGESVVKETIEDSFDHQFSIEASEIFPAESETIRKNIDKTQKLPMAEMFDASDENSVPKSLPKNVVNLQEHLRSSNYLEVAQNRVLELEKEVQKLRRDGEQLAAAGKHFKDLTDSLKLQVKQAESSYQNMLEISKEEKKILMQSLEAKEIKISALQERLEDVEQRHGSQYENVRIRERELENRLEIMKSENEALSKSKDEMILELKKQVQIVHSDLEKYRSQNQKMSAKIENKEELLRRTVKALRIALTMLEGSGADED